VTPTARSRIATPRRLATSLTIDPDERRLAGIVGGALWLIGGVILLLYPLLPGPSVSLVGLTLVLALLAGAWGAASVWLIDWRTAPQWWTHGSMLGALLTIPVAVHSTGGIHSTIWVFLLWVGTFAAYFFSRPVACAYLVLCVVAQSVPLIYGDHAVAHGFLTTLLVAAAGYAGVGGGVMAGKVLVSQLRARAETLASEQGSLQRIASAVIAGEDRDAVFELTAGEVAGLFDAAMVGIMQRTGDSRLLMLGEWADDSVRSIPLGTELDLTQNRGFLEAMAAGRASRLVGHAEGSVAETSGVDATLVAPIMVEERWWGVIALGAHHRGAYTRQEEQRLMAYCQLVASIVANLAERTRLATEALTDSLTGLGNRRALHDRLESELATALRHGHVLSVVMLDVDNFKEINDIGGHASGDDALRKVADCLRAVSRGGDTIGRVGGDEFMWIMPETDRYQAEQAVQRARYLIGEAVTYPVLATTSVGICDTLASADAEELPRLADIAMYASKVGGRNQVTLYDAAMDNTFLSHARGEWVERAQALSGLRALARAIDAKDHDTREHSERVAAFVGRLASAAGWTDDRIGRLREAALVHDVGKLGIPDAILTNPGRLTLEERVQMQAHVELSARIVGSVLSEEQVEWISCHHERPDGSGYPHGLTTDEIPEGAALIALADAWDVMVAGRPYTSRRSVDEAYAECLALSGRQFCEHAVQTLMTAREHGLLAGTEPVLLATEDAA
jgi:diguanylate cyclase (GGDEF)-like protein